MKQIGKPQWFIAGVSGPPPQYTYKLREPSGFTQRNLLVLDPKLREEKVNFVDGTAPLFGAFVVITCVSMDLRRRGFRGETVYRA